MIKNYFASGNTSVGFCSLYDEVVKDLDRLYILKGGPGTRKSTFIKEIAELMAEKGYDINLLHCSLNNQSLDGVIIPSIKLGVIDGTAPHMIEPIYPGIKEEIINLGDYLDTGKIRENCSCIIKLTNDIIKKRKMAYEQFAEAKKIHDEWEEIYLSGMDFNKANKITDTLLSKIFNDIKTKDENPITRRIFFGAATFEGYIHYIDNITEDIEKRYIIKGRPGTGKSTMMKKLAKHAKELGLSVEIYPCGFDPNSVDMVLIPSLKVIVVDGTAPHVINASRDSDEVIDMFELCIDPNIEIKYENELNKVESRYRIKMTIGTNYIKEAKKLNDKLEELYVKAMDFNALNNKKNELIAKVVSYANEITFNNTNLNIIDKTIQK